MPKTGSRIITVDGVRYRWRVRPAGSKRLRASVELADVRGRVLVVTFEQPRPDIWLGVEGHVAVPSEIADAIRRALALGYDPRSAGGPFMVEASVSAGEPCPP